MSRGFQRGFAASGSNRPQNRNTRDAKGRQPELSLEQQLAAVMNAHGQGQLADPAAAYRNLLDQGLNHPILLANLGQLEFAKGDLQASAELLQASLALQPEYAAVWSLLGTVQRRLGQPDAAEHSLRRALAYEPNQFPAWLALSVLLHDRGDLYEACAACQRAIEIDPRSAAAKANMAMVRLSIGDASEAESLSRDAISLDSELPEAHLNLGNALHALSRWEAALEAHQQALRLRPGFVQALSGSGNALHALSRLDEAVAAFQAALAHDPAYFQAYSNLAITLRAQGSLEDALAHADTATRLQPDSADVHSNMAVIWHDMGRLAEAETAYRRSLQLHPDHPDARFGLAMLLLQRSDYSEGWREYEWRFAHNDRHPIVREIDGVSRWLGPGRKKIPVLVLLHEQGFGDTLQFIRFAPLLRPYAQRVLFACPKQLMGLIADSGLVDGVVPLDVQSDQLPAGTKSLPLLSVPGMLGIEEQSFAVDVPYLPVAESRLQHWKQRLNTERLAEAGCILIGLNWQGNPEHEKNVSRGRSLPLESFAPLASLPTVQFLSLQKGFGSEQLATCSFLHRFVDCQHEIDEAWDFEDAAALIACCDLVISSDTSAAHLAGALASRLWMPLKKTPEWRWGLSTSTSPWYPSARLFRQPVEGDWASPIQAMLKLLRQDLPG